ncbi:MAG: tRNA (adenosine(37)-N6)-dimethylallyltransferase MiaA [Alphaproteobacteria bacterium]|nr:tRNA (adenosine(37)-N6)-dimethylallyltransferase MiaA [Alphaproteobacteria bacterium]
MAKVVIVAGPTASGKSAYAFRRALKDKGVILNGDSLQLYKGLEILTAQPPLKEQQTIPHRLYGFLSPTEGCSVGKWLPHVLREITKAHKEKRLPIVVGGTGLYLKALLEGISPLPPVDPKVRRSLKLPREALYAHLQDVDPELALKVNPHDHQRLLRGLEVFYGTGRPLSSWQTKKPSPSPFEFETILMMPSKENLEHLIALRLEEMIEKGVIEEISRILALSPSLNVMKAIGLREFGNFLEGRCTLEEAKKLTFIHSRQYAKRQRTWFRHQFKAQLIIDELNK